MAAHDGYDVINRSQLKQTIGTDRAWHSLGDEGERGIMGIFGDDKLQDKRIEALEYHVRALTETVQNNQADLRLHHYIMVLLIQV